MTAGGTAQSESFPVLDPPTIARDGTFNTWVSNTPGVSFLDDPSVADFDGDGILDLAVGESANVAVLYGVGDGTLRHGPILPGPSADLGVADLNRDGKLDIVQSYYLGVFLGR